MAELYAGTSGFAYPTWKPKFYPADLPSSRFLDHYATRLNCVEVNYTFRRLASEKTQQTWIAKTPDGFLFCPKAHMRITHVMRLKSAEEFTAAFLATLQPLKVAGRLGPILFQLPPQFQCDLQVFYGFTKALPKGQRYAFEFRHASWFQDDVFRILRDHEAALCVAESEKLQSPEVMTGRFAYFRLRKPEYSPQDRRAIAEKVQALLSGNKDVFVFFKHEDTPDGALNAEKLLRDVAR